MLVVRVNAFYTYAISLVDAVYIKFAFTIIINAYSLCKLIADGILYHKAVGKAIFVAIVAKSLVCHGLLDIVASVVECVHQRSLV